MTYTEEARQTVAKCVQPDGSLHNLGWFLSWDLGREEATLDGTFTAEELHVIADYMQRKWKP